MLIQKTKYRYERLKVTNDKFDTLALPYKIPSQNQQVSIIIIK